VIVERYTAFCMPNGSIVNFFDRNDMTRRIWVAKVVVEHMAMEQTLSDRHEIQSRVILPLGNVFILKDGS
jgi:hypothetical protein